MKKKHFLRNTVSRYGTLNLGLPSGVSGTLPQAPVYVAPEPGPEIRKLVDKKKTES